MPVSIKLRLGASQTASVAPFNGLLTPPLSAETFSTKSYTGSVSPTGLRHADWSAPSSIQEHLLTSPLIDVSDAGCKSGEENLNAFAAIALGLAASSKRSMDDTAEDHAPPRKRNRKVAAQDKDHVARESSVGSSDVDVNLKTHDPQSIQSTKSDRIWESAEAEDAFVIGERCLILYVVLES